MSNIIDTDSKIISSDRYGFGQPTLCRCSSTLMFAAHINDSSQLEIHKSINSGDNWTLVKTFTETDPEDFEMCAIDATSAAIAFIYGSNQKVYVTDDNGSTWVEKLAETHSLVKKSNIAYDPLESRLWKVFTRGDIFDLDYSDNKGDNWTSVNYDTNLGVGNFHASDMDINPLNSDVYVTIICEDTTNFERIYIFSKTGSYKSNSVLGFDTDWADACIIIDSGDNDYVITGYKHTDSKWYIAYAKNGTLDTSNFLLGSGAEVNYNDLVIPGSLSCAVDGDDNIYAFYTKASDEKCYYRKYNGSTWESETILVGIANDRISTEKRPISGSNKLHFVYYKAP